ncbi:MAG: hypothetical protein C4521_02540 [Actinobacteria bacterium]|nr:MAG: hypothetical protein C4521_02540 [Actinomycetota bacterium]
MSRPRLGHIQFLNLLPLYYGLVKKDVLLDVELVKGAPRDLTKALLEDGLDIAPIPSIEYCRNWRKLVLLDDISVSSDGEVQSILLLSKVPAEDLDGRPVALTNTSRTSQALVQIVLAEKYGVRPEYFESPPDLPQMMRSAEAALLIGDDALRVLYSPSSLLAYDLGAEWKELTGCKMVYAVWAVRREFAASQPEKLSALHWALLESMRYTHEHLDAISEYAARWETFPVSFLKSYFETLRFDFDEDYRAGLSLYFTKAKEMGFVDEVAPLNFVKDEALAAARAESAAH